MSIICHGSELCVCNKIISFKHWFHQSVLNDFFCMGWGTFNSYHNTSYNQISEINNQFHYKYQIEARMLIICHGSELCVYNNIIVVNYWFYQSVLNKHWFDGWGAYEIISEHKLWPNQWKNSIFTTYIKLGP